jgi:phosphatidylglycerophosphatase A
MIALSKGELAFSPLQIPLRWAHTQSLLSYKIMKTPPIFTPSLTDLLRRPIHFISFGFGSGLLPKMPGTWGTVVAIPIYLLIAHNPLWLYALITCLLIGFSFYACDVTARDIGVHDHPGIVLDEIVGYLLTMLAIPVAWPWVLAGFVLFRLFDIWKPWPIKWVDKHVKGGFGIVVDDLLAAVYAWIVLQMIIGAVAFYQ